MKLRKEMWENEEMKGSNGDLIFSYWVYLLLGVCNGFWEDQSYLILFSSGGSLGSCFIIFDGFSWLDEGYSGLNLA